MGRRFSSESEGQLRSKKRKLVNRLGAAITAAALLGAGFIANEIGKDEKREDLQIQNADKQKRIDDLIQEYNQQAENALKSCIQETEKKDTKGKDIFQKLKGEPSCANKRLIACEMKNVRNKCQEAIGRIENPGNFENPELEDLANANQEQIGQAKKFIQEADASIEEVMCVPEKQ